MRELFEGSLSSTRVHTISRSVRVTVITCMIVGAYAISVQKTNIDVSTFIRGLPSGLELVSDFDLDDAMSILFI